MFSNGSGILGNLIAFGKIRVKIIFTVKPAFPVDPAMGGKSSLDGKADGQPVQYRQDSRHTGADRAGVGIGGFSEFSRATAENFGFCFELRMDFKTYDRFKLHVKFYILWFFLIFY